MKTYFHKLLWLPLVLGAVVLTGCDSDSGAASPPPPPPAMATFAVTVTNLTNAQPLSPAAIIAHGDAYAVFSIGAPASVGLEEQAEGGDNSALLAEADGDADVFTTASGAAPIGPAGSETISVDVLESELAGLRISMSTMLVNTNDAITVLDGLAVGDLQVNDSISARTVAYDSGTEANSELAAHIPGPAGGGEGFNATRDDLEDRVAMHIGIVGQDDGFEESVLTGQHRFNNPVAEVRIERIN